MSFILARLKSGHTAPVSEKTVAADEEFLRGALLLMDANGEYAECGADPTAVAAVAESDYGPDTTGFNRFGSKGFPPGKMQGTKVEGETWFHAEYVGTLPAAVGGSYGVVRDTDGQWKVDFSETTAQVVKLVGFWTEAPINKNRVFVVFLPDVVQII